MSILVERLNERLEACGTNASRASLETGFGRQCIRDVVAGKSKSPSIAFVAAAARVLGCSVAYLIGETDELHGALETELSSLRNIAQGDIRPADRLRTAREEIFHTASAAARAMGVAIPTYVHHENGTREFDVEAASTYAVAFDVSASWLLGIPAPFEVRADQTTEPMVVTLPKLTELRDEIETAYDLLTALDKTGDCIGGDVGHGVSAVALAARAALDNARSMLKAMEGTR